MLKKRCEKIPLSRSTQQVNGVNCGLKSFWINFQSWENSIDPHGSRKKSAISEIDNSKRVKFKKKNYSDATCDKTKTSPFRIFEISL